MPDTTSNQMRTIATKGSNHTAIALAPDMCFVPGNPVPQPFPNTVPSTRLLAGQTTKTLIGAQPIVTSAGEIGPPSDPGHAGTLGGVKSGTYRFEAQATSYSRDVFTEGNPVVRTIDRTTQNHGNTTGLIVALFHTADINATRDAETKKCTITKIKGEDGDGRQLGFPGKKGPGDEPNYLEILSDDTVTFESFRYDIAQDPNEEVPDCQGGPHTAWTARTLRKPMNNPVTKGPEIGETFEVAASFALSWPLSTLATGDQASAVTKRKDEEPDWDKKKQDEIAKRRKEAGKTRDGRSRRSKMLAAENNARAAVNRERDAWNKKQNPTVPEGKKISGADRAVEQLKNFRELLLLWMLRADPPMIDVEALGCAGTKNATLKVFPAKKFTFTFALGSSESKEGDKYFGMIRTACGVLKKVIWVAEKIAAVAGEKLSVKFLHGFKLQASVQYKKCKADKKSYWGNDFYTMARVNRTWEFGLYASPLIGVEGRFNISLLNFVIPFMGQTVGSALRRFKILRADIVFGVVVGCNLGISLGMDEYDYPTKTGSKIGIDVTLSLALVLGGASIDLVALKGSFPAKFAVGAYLGNKPGVILQLAPEGSIRVGLTLTLFPDRWYEIEAFSAWPKSLQYKYSPARIDALVLPT